jgi:hypothetical protein
MCQNFFSAGDHLIKITLNFLFDFMFELCDCLYDGHWMLIWSLISGPVELVEVRAS